MTAVVLLGLLTAIAACSDGGETPPGGTDEDPQGRRVELLFVHAAPYVGDVSVRGANGELRRVARAGESYRFTVSNGDTVSVLGASNSTEIVAFDVDAAIGDNVVAYVLTSAPATPATDVRAARIPAAETGTTRVINALAQSETVSVQYLITSTVNHLGYADFTSDSPAMPLTVVASTGTYVFLDITPAVAPYIVLSGSATADVAGDNAIRAIAVQQRAEDNQTEFYARAAGARQFLSAIPDANVDVTIGGVVLDGTPDDSATSYFAFADLSRMVIDGNALSAKIGNTMIFGEDATPQPRATTVLYVGQAISTGIGAVERRVTAIDTSRMRSQAPVFVVNATVDIPELALEVDGTVIATGATRDAAVAATAVVPGGHEARVSFIRNGDIFNASAGQFANSAELQVLVITGSFADDPYPLRILSLARDSRGELTLTEAD